jgi:hypothetical protein
MNVDKSRCHQRAIGIDLTTTCAGYLAYFGHDTATYANISGKGLATGTINH